MPKKHYIVVILDVNSIPREAPAIKTDDEIGDTSLDEGVDNNNGQNQNTTPGGTAMSTSSSSAKKKNNDTKVPLPPYNYEMVKSIKEMVLTLLAKEALEYHTEKFDFSQVFWSIKLYNSSTEINSKTGRSFQPIGIESIDAFEKQLESFLDTSSQSAIKSDPNINQIQFLSTSLKSVLGDLPWPEPISSDDMSGNDNRNVIHAMFRVPQNETEVQSFVPNWTSAAGSKTIMNELLPKAFCRKMREHQIQLHFMDLMPAYKTTTTNDYQNHNYWETNETSLRPMIKIAHYLGGKITPFTQISRGVPIGLPSYADLLKQLLIVGNCQGSSDILMTNSKSKLVLDESHKTIRKLHGSMNGSIVNLNDTTDGESIRSNNIRIPIPAPSYALTKHQRERRSCPEMVQHNKINSNIIDSTGNNRWVEYGGGPDDGQILLMRYSDERERHLQRRQHRLPLPNHHDEIHKKRKYEFEEDMESEEGYSPTDIENWCMGETAVKAKHQTSAGSGRRNVGGGVIMGGSGNRERNSNFNNQKQQQQQQNFTKHPQTQQKYISPQILQPQKRIRRDRDRNDEEIMAPPIRHHRHSDNSQIFKAKQRYSDPISTSSSHHNNKSTGAGIVATTSNNLAFRTRGRVMVNEGLKKKVNNQQNNKTKQKNGQNHTAVTDTDLVPQTNFWKENEKILTSYKHRFHLLLQSARTTGRREDPIDDLAVRAKWFIEMIIREEDCCLPSTAQALVTTIGASLVELQVRDLRGNAEKILLIPYEDLNLEVIRLKNTDDEDAVFQKCYLQILLHFEMVWTLPIKTMSSLEEQFVDDVTRILGLVRVYRKKPPIDEFVNDVLVPLYHPTHGRLLRDITETMNIRVSSIMLNNSFDSPRSGSGSGCRDDCSVSSFNSSMCGPEDSTSQHPNDNSFSQQSQHMNQSQHSVRTSLRTASFLSVNNPKRALMLPVSKLPNKPKIYHHKSQSQSTQSGSLRPVQKSPKPKKVRRNLFDVQASRDPKDMKMLMNLATSNSSSFSRSPSLFKSPMSKHSCSPRLSPGPGRPSPFFAAARARAAKSKGRSSRRRLIMDPEDEEEEEFHPQFGTLSCSPNESLLCPESPFTPQEQPEQQQRKTPGSGKSIVHESPEIIKSKIIATSVGSKSGLYRFGRRIDSVSFYSSGNESLKSRAWERSGAKLAAARIRDSADLSQTLSLSDLEFIDSSGQNNAKRDDNNETRQEEDGSSPVPCCSKSCQDVNNMTATDEQLMKASLHALIHGEIISTTTEILNFNATLPASAAASTITTIRSPGLDTPSKRVQFSLELVSPTTPARSHNVNPVTPKSILKDAGNTNAHT